MTPVPVAVAKVQAMSRRIELIAGAVAARPLPISGEALYECVGSEITAGRCKSRYQRWTAMIWWL